ncbi:MAG: hypothetical protein IJW53_00100 [Clostridia bacterium]|nr:hypothetical protein [Clostridia bacterium]
MKGFDKSKLILSAILGIPTAAIGYYFFLPALNLRSYGFWFYLTAVIAAFAVPWLNISIKDIVANVNKSKISKKARKQFNVTYTFTKSAIIALVAVAVPLAVVLFGFIFSSQVFQARSYAKVITVTEAEFDEDMPETTEINHIALMDTASAQVLGDKTLGALSEVISQYDVSEYYTQINFKGTPKKVSNLEYDDFFKWIANNTKGVPGMVMVDPVKSDAEYIELETPMIYVNSAFFGQDLMRKLRFEYPTKIFDSVSFEIDDNKNPYYIVSCVKPRVGLFGAKDINEVIIFNPCDGSSTLYKLEDVPSWVDIVFTGDLACKKFDWQGLYSGGFLNSIIGNVGCRQTTDDYGYVALEDDVWYFTGVTSVTADKSNVGFMLSNARTGKYKFYPVIGAEEHSAMSAAEGQVQEKGYVASFPSLVNVSGQATYILVLKDDTGIVKLYALVNVENYSIVATGTTQAAVMSAYKKLLQQNNIGIGDSNDTAEITVENVRIAMVSDVSTVYITATDGKVYKGYLEADESLILVRVGDKLNVNFFEGDTKNVYVISSWSFADDNP